MLLFTSGSSYARFDLKRQPYIWKVLQQSKNSSDGSVPFWQQYSFIEIGQQLWSKVTSWIPLHEMWVVFNVFFRNSLSLKILYTQYIYIWYKKERNTTPNLHHMLINEWIVKKRIYMYEKWINDDFKVTFLFKLRLHHTQLS